MRATVGSSNLDWRSFLHKDELNVVILGREFGAAMGRLFVADLDQVEEVDAAAWSRRGTGHRLMEWLGRTWEYRL